MDPIYPSGCSLAVRSKLSQHIDNLRIPSHFVNVKQLSVETTTFTDRTLLDSQIPMSSIPDPAAESNPAIEDISGILKRSLGNETNIAPLGPLPLRKKRYSYAYLG